MFNYKFHFKNIPGRIPGLTLFALLTLIETAYCFNNERILLLGFADDNKTGPLIQLENSAIKKISSELVKMGFSVFKHPGIEPGRVNRMGPEQLTQFCDTTGFSQVIWWKISRQAPGADGWRIEMLIWDNRLHQSVSQGYTVESLESGETVDIMVLKILNYYQKELLGVLELTTIPPGAMVRMNNKFAGNTPFEMWVRKGRYELEIKKKLYKPERFNINIEPGKKTGLSPVLRFKGYPQKWWLAGSLISLGLAAWLHQQQQKAYQEYHALDWQSSKAEFDRYYKRAYYYNLSMYTGLGLSGAMGGLSFHYYFKNKSAKKASLF